MDIRRFLPISFFVVLFACVVSAEGRTWTSITGGKLEGEMLGSDANSVTIKRTDGNTIKVPLTKLSQADRDFVKTAPKAENAEPEKKFDGENLSELPADEWVMGTYGNYRMKYRFYGKTSLDPSKKYPLVIYLHGRQGAVSSEDGGAAIDPPETFVTEEAYLQRPCYVLAPQLPLRKHWTSGVGTDVVHLARALIEALPIDPNRIYLLGHSTGAVGMWHLLREHREFFAAGVSSAGAWDPEIAHWISHIPIWAFHGDADTLVPVDRLKALIERIIEKDGEPKVTIFPGEGQEILDKVYGNQEVHQWLFSQTKRGVLR